MRGWGALARWAPFFDDGGNSPSPWNGAPNGTFGPAFQTFTAQGAVVVQTYPARFRFPVPVTIDSIVAEINTAPTGASLVVDVLKNGATLYPTNPGNRATIAAGSNASTTSVPDTTAIAAGDYLQISPTQVGSTIAGSDLTVTIRYH